MVGIPVQLNILLIILFILAGFLECKRLLSKDPTLDMKTILKKAPYLYVLIPLSVIFLIAANLNRPYLTWDLPLWLQYCYTALTWGAIIAMFAFTFSLASVLAFRTKHRERWKIVIAGALFIGVVQILQWNYTRPIAPQLKDIEGSSGLVFQSNDASCAAASAANIARMFGIRKTEKKMAELLGTTAAGTSAAQIIYGMRKIGFSCRKVEIADSNPQKIKLPAMMFVNNQFAGPESHAVTYVRFRNGKAEIWDPLEGKLLYSKSELAKVWHGRAIEFSMDKEL